MGRNGANILAAARMKRGMEAQCQTGEKSDCFSILQRNG